MRWGLIPHWSKDQRIGQKCINARQKGGNTTSFGLANHRLPKPFLAKLFGVILDAVEPTDFSVRRESL